VEQARLARSVWTSRSSMRPSAQRHSIATLRPSIQPSLLQALHKRADPMAVERRRANPSPRRLILCTALQRPQGVGSPADHARRFSIP